MVKHIILLLSVGLLLAAPEVGHAQLISKKGTAAAQFLLIPVGTRAAALGGAVTATSTDVTSMYWNAGGLAAVKQGQFVVEHASWVAGLNHNYVGIALPAAGGTVGLSLIALTMDDMEETTFADQDGTGLYFGAGSYAVGLSYGRYLLNNFAIGGTVKYVTERIKNTSASAIAVDIGTTYVTPFDGIRFGVRIANFGNKPVLRGDDLITTVDIDPGSEGNNNQIDAYLKTKPYAMPLTLQVGLAWDAWQGQGMRATVMADASSPSDNNQSVNLGAELAFMEGRVSLQAGLPELGLPDRMWLWSAGGQVRTAVGGRTLSVGYAMQMHEYLGATNRMALTMNF